MIKDDLEGQRAVRIFNERILNNWFADDFESYAKYYAAHQNGNVMLANLKRDNFIYYSKLEALARQEEDNRK